MIREGDVADPFTIRIFVADGDPDGIRLIERTNWAGLGIVFPRQKWGDAAKFEQLDRPGVYILVGYARSEDELPTLYIGQSDGARDRLKRHVDGKDFWDWGIVFVASNGVLNRAHITWLEYALIKQARQVDRCHLQNSTYPQEPSLSEAEKADMRAFLKEILQILPLARLRALEVPRNIISSSQNMQPVKGEADTIVVPAQRDGFERVFLGQHCWHAIRLRGGMIDKIKYIAAYQTQPISAITHYAQVASIEPYGEDGKYKLNFSGPAQEIGPIHFADATNGSMQGPRYTNFAKLQTAKKVADLF